MNDEYKDEDGSGLSREALEMRKLTKDVYKNAARLYAEALKGASDSYRAAEQNNKKAVYLLDEPIIVLQSKTSKSSIVLFGEVFTESKKPVMLSLLLNPQNKSGEILDFAIVTSAYSRRKNNVQNLINESEIYYVNENKNRTDKWLSALGLQLPSAITKYDSINRISENSENVKENSEKTENFDENEAFRYQNRDTEYLELAKNSGRTAEKLYYDTAGEIEARDTANRANLTAEERKNTRPDIDRTDVVFAGGAVRVILSTEILIHLNQSK